MADYNPMPGGAFHRFSGLDVELSVRNTVASIGGKRVFYHARGSDQDGGYQIPRPVINMRRVVFSSEPIEITGTFQVHVTRRKYKAGDTRIEFFPEDNRGTKCNPHQSMVSPAALSGDYSTNSSIHSWLLIISKATCHLIPDCQVYISTY